MTEYDHEPIRGLPGDLPAGEEILWQGSPDWRTFARSALYTRYVAGYFAILALVGIASGSMFGAVTSVIAGVIVHALLALFAVLVGRTTVYTITNRRVVARIGIALNKCINLPLGQIASANLRPQPAGHGDIALTLLGKHRLGYAVLWPHARPMQLAKPQPMLRALPDAARAADILARACAAIAPVEIAVNAANLQPAKAKPAQGRNQTAPAMANALQGATA
ncbi:MAG: photosynthetic complex assembly protein [Novosphingobium sp. 32-60-15]|uniref:photosynthetic complex putative assembly protein PuhB n=1 Tax=unclassified Novosphingobium TaxID=2644732 RepID=UPI000BD19344|nr:MULTISPECIES: photosynthetic complex putative assembly protein PuhB [unclassified Novosphingobium]OYX64136.1 MAG: photosynthetic complex assembly protein [Novosphingobium sp. 32-60-15]